MAYSTSSIRWVNCTARLARYVSVEVIGRDRYHFLFNEQPQCWATGTGLIVQPHASHGNRAHR